MKSSRTNIKYFPFAPGLPYQIKNGKYIIPQMDNNHWFKAVAGEEVVVTAYGGLFESLFSLSIFELINKRLPGKKMYWSGNEEFNQLSYLNGLGQARHFIDQDKLVKYPVPIFFDGDGRSYFNCLNNYIDVNTYYGEFKFKDKKPLTQQLFNNTMVDWSLQYLPQLRNIKEPAELKEWSLSHHFKSSKPFVLFIDSDWSQHEASCLNWDIKDMRSFSAMLRPTSLSFVVLTKDPQRYPGLKAYMPPFNLDVAMFLTSEASSILSKEIDWLLIAMLISKASVIYDIKNNEFDLEKNKEYLGVSNDINSFNATTTLQAFNAVKI